MNSYYTKIWRILLFMVVVVFLVSFCLPRMYMKTYDLINKLDSSIYQRYATNNKYTENIYFNSDVENSTGIVSDLANTMKGMQDIDRIQDFAKIICDDSDGFIKVAKNNKMYMEYLAENGVSINDVVSWADKISSLDDNVMSVCIYIVFLLFSFIMVVLFKYRKSFYILAGIVYMIFMTSIFSNGLTDYVVANFISVIASFTSNTFTYQDMNDYQSLLANAFKESMLTFIIFDTIIQMHQNAKKESEIKTIRYITSSIECQLRFLFFVEYINDCKFKGRLKINPSLVVNRSQTKIKQLNKQRIKLSKYKNISLERIDGEINSYNKLINNMKKITNTNEYSCVDEFINILLEVKILLYTCKFSCE